MNTLSWILAAILVVSLIFTIIVYIKYCKLTNRIVVVQDIKPKKDTANAKFMQLSNELAKYLIETEDTVSIKVVEP